MSQHLFVVALFGTVVFSTACGSGATQVDGIDSTGAAGVEGAAGVVGGGGVTGSAGVTADAVDGAAGSSGGSGTGAVADAGTDGGGDASAEVSHGSAVSMVVVPATANIFGSGHPMLPAPGGGPGTVPVLVPLPPGTHRTLTFTDVSGRIDLDGAGTVLPESGADGLLIAAQPIPAGPNLYGIGSLSSDRILFLVGVFLDDTEPTAPGPAATTADPAATIVSPGLRGAVFVGDGLNVSLDGVGVVQTFVIPEGATRFFLGFADFLGPGGPIGGFDDNVGQIMGTMTITY